MDQSTKDRFSNGFRGKKPEDGAGVAIVIAPNGDSGSSAAENVADAGTQGAGAGDTGPGTGSEGGEDDAGMPPMTHNEKTWQGRLAKREAELRAKEAALAGGAGATTEPATTPAATDPEPMGDDLGLGGEGEGDAGAIAGEGLETPAEEAAETPGNTEDGGEIDVGGKKVAIDEILANAPAEIKSIVEALNFDLGDDFVNGIIKIVSYVAEYKAGKAATDALGPLKQQADDIKGTLDTVIDNFSSMHRGDIEDNEPDFEAVVNSPEFEQWVMSQEPDTQSRIVRTLEGGSAMRIVRVLKDFKDWTAAQAVPQAGQIDTSALEAAGAVRSAGSPVPDLSSGATSSPDDAFRRGFYRGQRKA